MSPLWKHFKQRKTPGDLVECQDGCSQVLFLCLFPGLLLFISGLKFISGLLLKFRKVSYHRTGGQQPVARTGLNDSESRELALETRCVAGSVCVRG